MDINTLPTEFNSFSHFKEGAWLYKGGLQVRGVDPSHEILDLHKYWQGDSSINDQYDILLDADIPFAQDCFGDQFIYREGEILLLSAECGELEHISESLSSFFSWVKSDPYTNLNITDDLEVSIGELLFAWPPYCTEQGDNATIKATPAHEVIALHADLAKKIGGLPDGGSLSINVVD